MPKWKYTITTEELDPEKTVKASGRELRISHKATTEICNTIKKMKLNQAKQYLQQVITKKKPVPYRRFTKKQAHRHGIEKAYAGRYPVKAAKEVLGVLKGAEANAEYKGLDPEKLQIIHASAHPGMKIKRYMRRAFGRSSPRFQTLCHVEIILQQTETPEETA